MPGNRTWANTTHPSIDAAPFAGGSAVAGQGVDRLRRCSSSRWCWPSRCGLRPDRHDRDLLRSRRLPRSGSGRLSEPVPGRLPVASGDGRGDSPRRVGRDRSPAVGASTARHVRRRPGSRASRRIGARSGAACPGTPDRRPCGAAAHRRGGHRRVEPFARPAAHRLAAALPGVADPVPARPQGPAAPPTPTAASSRSTSAPVTVPTSWPTSSPTTGSRRRRRPPRRRGSGGGAPPAAFRRTSGGSPRARRWPTTPRRRGTGPSFAHWQVGSGWFSRVGPPPGGATGPDRPPGRARLSCRAGRSPKGRGLGDGNPADTLTRSWTSGPRDRTTRGFGDGTDDGIPPRDQRR